MLMRPGAGLDRVLAAAGLAAALIPSTAVGQGADSGGHPTLNGFGVFAAWNPEAGGTMSGGYATEDNPNRDGWDYRINLPYVRLLPTYPSARSGAAMVGVIEDTTFAATTLQESLHVNNSIWLFAVDQGGILRFKVLPSHRSTISSEVENVTSLSDGWYPVGPSGTTFLVEKPCAVVLGAGIGTATIHVVARAADGRLLLSSRQIDSTQITDWSTPWIEVAPQAGPRPSASAAFGDQVAISWIVGFPARVDLRLYAPSTGAFGPVATVTRAGALPQLVWDGTALNLLYIGPILQQNVWHIFATSPSLSFGPPTQITDTVINTQCDAIAFNYRLHLACSRIAEGASQIWYSTSTTPFGIASAWEPASPVGLLDHVEPQLGTVGGELYVVASRSDGILEYARKDSHVRAYEWTGGTVPVERWLEVGSEVDEMQKFFEIGLFGAELLSFNHDLYLTAAEDSSAPTAGLYLTNFSRAALKKLIFRRLGMRFVWGRDSDDQLFAPGADPIAAADGTFLLADVNRDSRADLIRAVEASAGGELRVALSAGNDLDASSQWLAQFARPGDVVRAGDIDGDGDADILRLFQSSGFWIATIAFSSGTGVGSQFTWRSNLGASDSTPLIGDVDGDGRDDLVIVRFGAAPAPVDVAAAAPNPFGEPSTWSSEMAVTGDIPLLADVDGDGCEDLVVVSHTPPLGGGLPPVWVALSTGSSFAPRAEWSSTDASCRSFDVGDMNQDGREDLLCFLRDKFPWRLDPRSVQVYFAEDKQFSLTTTLLTSFAGENDLPLVGDLSGDTVATYTHFAEGPSPPILDLLDVNLTTGRVGWMQALGLFPVPSGAPWERYRFFTEKGIGTAMFPEWLWTSTPCVKPAHRYLLLGIAGSGSPDVTRLSVRPGSSEVHVLEELGHSIFFNCFPGADDPFGLTDDIHTLPTSQGGFHANLLANSCTPLGTPLPGAPSWLDCRDPQHYFLRFMRTYRTGGDVVRSSIAAETDPSRKAHYQAQYDWLRNHWFNGAEYYRDPTAVDARRETIGVQCLPGLCGFPWPPLAPPDPLEESSSTKAASPAARR